MGFVWLTQYECAACGAGTPTTERDDESGFRVCRACSRRSARVRQ